MHIVALRTRSVIVSHCDLVIIIASELQADKERQEAEEMQKELGLGSQSDSLVMMLQVKQKSSFTI